MFIRPTRPYKAYWAFAGQETTTSTPGSGTGGGTGGGGGTTSPAPSPNDPSKHTPSKDWYKKHPFHPQKPKKTKVVIIKEPVYRRPRVIVHHPMPIYWVIDHSGHKRKHKHKGRKPDIGECVKTNGGRLYRGRVECENPDKRNCSETVFGKNCEDAESNFCKMYGSLGGRCDGNPKYVPQTSGKDTKSEEPAEEEPAPGAVSGGFDFNNIPMPILLGGGLLVVMMMFMMMRK